MRNDEATTGGPLLSELERYIVTSAEELAFPPSAWEADTLSEVLALPRVLVTRPPEDELIEIGMRRNDCHANCAAQAVNDTDGKSRHVTGWYVSGSDLILHSVAQIDGRWFCLTPQLGKPATQFEFIPDSSIEWRESPDRNSQIAVRYGRELPQALRRHPEIHIRKHEQFLAFMASGMSAVEARDRVNSTARQDSL